MAVMFSMIRTYHHFELVLVAEFCDFFEGGDLKWSLTDRGLVDSEMWKGNKLGILTDLLERHLKSGALKH